MSSRKVGPEQKLAGTQTGQLPKTVQQIADVIGREAALRLVNQLPRAYSKGHPSGQPILYVPKSLRPEHPLVRMLGFPDAQQLVQVFGGEVLYPAACVGFVRQARNREVVRLLSEGWNERDIARAFGLTTRQVHNLKEEIAPEEQRRRTMQAVA